LLDTRFVNALDKVAANQDPRHGGVAEAPYHVGLDSRCRRIEKGVPDVVARKDSSDLPAIGAPRGAIQEHAFAAAGFGRRRSQKEQGGRDECGK